MLRLRQVVLVAAELSPVVDQLRAHLHLEVCHRDPGVGAFGLCNALLAVGDSFIEVLAPIRDGTTAGRYLQRRGGDGGYMVILQTDDLAAQRARMASLGVRVVWEGQGPGIEGMHLHPKDVGGAILSLDQAEPPGSWGWAGPAGERTAGASPDVSGIAAVELQSDDPEGLATRWSQVLGRPVVPSEAGPDGAGCIPTDVGEIRFSLAGDGRGEGLSGIDLTAVDPGQAGQELTMGGVRWCLVAPG